MLRTSKNFLLSGSLIMIFGSFFTSFVNYLYHLIMGRILGPADYGILASIISLVGLLSLASSSFGLAVTKIVASAKEKEEIIELAYTLNKHIWIIGIISFIILFLLSPLIANFLKVQEFLLIIGLSVFLLSFPVSLTRSILHGRMMFKFMVIAQVSENILRLLGGMLLVFYGLFVGGALFGLFLGSCFGWLIGWIFVRDFLQKPKIENVKINLRSTLRSSLPFLFLSVSITSLYSSDLILVKHFFSSFDAGIYAAMSFLGRIIFFGVSPITAVMFPIVVKSYSRRESSTSVLKWSLVSGLILSAFVIALYWLFPNLVVTTLYGEKYSSAGDILVLFGIFMSFVTLSFLLLNYALALGRNRSVLVSSLAAIVQIVSIWIFHSNLASVVIISMLISLALFAYLLFDTLRIGFIERKGYDT